MDENATLVKFGLFEHLVQLRDYGLLYMNNLPYFWKLEDEELRGDSYDSINSIIKGKKGSLVDQSKTSIPVINWKLKFSPPDADKINIFCLFALRPQKGTYPVSFKNYRFGTHALVFTKPQEFINKLYTYIAEKTIKAEADLVDYVDDSYIGKIGPFIKLRKFSYQSEWRLVCFDGSGKVRKLFIGSFQDISIIMPIEEINDKIKMSNYLTPNLFSNC